VLVSGVGVGGKPCQKETGKIRLFWPPSSEVVPINLLAHPEGGEEAEFRMGSPTNFGRTDSCGAFVAMAYKWH